MFDEELIVKSSLYISQIPPLACPQWCIPLERERGEKVESFVFRVVIRLMGLTYLHGGLTKLISLHLIPY